MKFFQLNLCSITTNDEDERFSPKCILTVWTNSTLPTDCTPTWRSWEISLFPIHNSHNFLLVLFIFKNCLENHKVSNFTTWRELMMKRHERMLRERRRKNVKKWDENPITDVVDEFKEELFSSHFPSLGGVFLSSFPAKWRWIWR